MAYYPHVGGAEVAIKEITDRLSPSEFEFHMVTLRFSKEDAAQEKIGNIVVHRIGRGSKSKVAKFLYQLRAARVATKLHTTHPFDVVWAMMAHSAGVPAALFKKKYSLVPYVLTLQEGDPIPHIERTMRPLWPLFTRAFTTANSVQAISNYLGVWARTRGFAGPLEIIPNGADIQKFVGEPVSHTGTVLITTSRLVHKNALDVVIHALPQLPDVKFQILGVGPDEVKLRALAQTLGVASRVEFVGFVPGNDIPRYLHKADIFIRPSRSEGMGSSFVEAMAAGLPVIATQEGGIADFLFDAKRNPDKSTTGWAVDKDSPEQVVFAVKDILSNPEDTKKVVENAQKLVKDRYDWNYITGEMRERVFVKLLKKN